AEPAVEMGDDREDVVHRRLLPDVHHARFDHDALRGDDGPSGGRVLMSFATADGWKRKCFYERLSMKSPTHMARDRDSGFHSAAGLIRYFDQEDEKALKVPPMVVVLLSVVVSGII